MRFGCCCFLFLFFFNFYLKSPTAIVRDKRKCKADMCLRKYIRLISYIFNIFSRGYRLSSTRFITSQLFNQVNLAEHKMKTLWSGKFEFFVAEKK